MPGTLTYSPADVLRRLLVSLGHGVLPSAVGSWPISCNTLPDSPDSVVALIDTTGVHQGRIMVDGEVVERHGVQVLVRDSRFVAGWTKARQIVIALDGIYTAGVTISTNTYCVHAVSRSSGPIALGDEATSEGGNIPISKRQLFSINCTVSVRETS